MFPQPAFLDDFAMPTAGRPSGFGTGIKVGVVNAHKVFSKTPHSHGTGAPRVLAGFRQSRRVSFLLYQSRRSNEWKGFETGVCQKVSDKS